MYKNITEEFNNDGYTVIRNLLSEKDLSKIHSFLIKSYSHLFHFPNALSLLEKINNCEVLNTKIKTRIDNLLPYVNEIALNKPQIMEIFAKALNIENLQNLKLSEFCDFRMNVPLNSKLRNPTGWHQDIQTDYCYFPNQLSYPSATCWIAVSDSNEQNSIQIIPKSHLNRKIYYQDYRNLNFDPMNLKNSLDWQMPKTIEAKCGDAIIFDQFLWHRTNPNHSSKTRFSIDVRFLDLGTSTPPFDADFRLLRFRYEKYLYKMFSKIFLKSNK
jgi:ectoine hydroxylase-related dioxygenase (phytanoyl-CoA dioxygenase family)